MRDRSPWDDDLVDAVAAVQAATTGGRNATLNRAAYAVGQRLHWSGASRERAEVELAQAARSVGLRDVEIRGTLRAALDRGALQPRDEPTKTRGRRRRRRRRDAVQPVAAPEVEPTRLDADDVAAVWAASASIFDSATASEWCVGRGIDPEWAAMGGAARVLPDVGPLPKWAHRWRTSGRDIVFGVFDERGALVGLRGRLTRPERAGEPKEKGPKGQQARHTVYADCAGVELLRGGSWARSFVDRQGVVVVVEGGPDTLCWSARRDSDERPLAVLGIFAGCWSRRLADRVPDGVRVVIATDADDAGESYAETIRDTFKGRSEVAVVRAVPPDDAEDWGEVARQTGAVSIPERVVVNQ